MTLGLLYAPGMTPDIAMMFGFCMTGVLVLALLDSLWSRGMNKRSAGLFAMLAAFGPVEGRQVQHEKPVKPCRNCGKEHRHNNLYCSAKCCREHG